MKKNALLVVDVQRFYLGDIPPDLSAQIVKHYESVPYDLIAFTVFRNSKSSGAYKLLKWSKVMRGKDTELPEDFVHLANKNNVFERSHWSGFKDTNLDKFLRSNGIERLVICGVDTDACVLATAFEAFDLGYHVKIEFSLCFSTNNLGNEAEKIARKSLISRD